MFLPLSLAKNGIDSTIDSTNPAIRSCPTSAAGTPLNSASLSRRNSVFTSTLPNEKPISVLLEASYKKRGDESLYGYNVKVRNITYCFYLLLTFYFRYEIMTRQATSVFCKVGQIRFTTAIYF